MNRHPSDRNYKHRISFLYIEFHFYMFKKICPPENINIYIHATKKTTKKMQRIYEYNLTPYDRIL